MDLKQEEVEYIQKHSFRCGGCGHLLLLHDPTSCFVDGCLCELDIIDIDCGCG